MADNGCDIRNIVLNMLSKTYDEGIFSSVLIAEINADDRFDIKDKNFMIALYMGTVEKTVYLDYLLDKTSKVPVLKMKPVIRNILRMGLYQIKFMDSVPHRAAVSESLRLCDKRKLTNLKGFVNGVLRNLERSETGDIPKHVVYSVPKWIYDLIKDEYGNEIAEKYFEAISRNHKEISVKAMSNDTEKVKALLEKDGCIVKEVGVIKDAFYISGFESIEKLDAFKNGDIFIQDVSSMLVSDIAFKLFNNIHGKDKCDEKIFIVDVCAAPGGKSIGLAKRFTKAEIKAMDISKKKVALIKENTERLHIRNIDALKADARKPLEEYKEKADILICDLSCSGLGVIGKKKDIMLRVKPEDIYELSDLQREIVEKSMSYLKYGGILIYSTCTLTKKENIENAIRFADTLDLEFLPMDGIISAGFINDEQKKQMKNGYLQLINGINETDGFFISAFLKKSQ